MSLDVFLCLSMFYDVFSCLAMSFHIFRCFSMRFDAFRCLFDAFQCLLEDGNKFTDQKLNLKSEAIFVNTFT